MQAAAMLKYLLIPLRGPSLALVAIFSILLLIAVAGGLIGLPLALLTVSWFFKYGFALLDHVADGVIEPPVLAYEMLNPLNESRPLGLLLIVFVYGFATEALRYWFGGDVVAALRVLGVLLLPAVIMTQAASTFWESLNPILLLQIVIRVPGSYLFILAVLGGFWWLASLLVTWLPAAQLPFSVHIPFSGSLRIALIMYAFLASFAMIGGVLFERRKELGFEPAHSPERAAEKENRERQREIDLLIDRIFAEWRGGAYGNAWRTIEAHLQNSERPSDDLRALFARAVQWPDGRLAYRLAEELVPQLLAARRTGDALNIARSQLRVDARFKPVASSDAIKLIELARDAGDRSTARMLLAGFDEKYDDESARRVAAQLAQQLER